MHSTSPSPCYVAPLHGLLLSMTLAAARVHAQPGSACADPRLRVEGVLAARWLAPVVELCETLSAMRDLDPSARLRLVAAGDDVIVEVTLDDGRSTLRRVRAPSELPLTVEALVSVLPEPAAEPSAPPITYVEPSASPVHVEAARPARRFGLELGIAAVGRIAGPPQYVSIGVSGYAGVRTGPWLLALSGRFDGYQTVTDDRPRDFEMTTSGGGFSLLHELALSERGTLEAGLGTWLLGETQAYTPERLELVFSSFDVRMSALTRWIFGVAPYRYFVGLDVELSPSRMRHAPHLSEDLPSLPAWSTGLSLGFAWEPP